jgi:hypothetical protein
MGSRLSDRCPNSFLDEHLVIISSLAGIDENELWICNTQLSVSNLDNFPGVSMMNRSVFLSLAAGLLASLALTAPSHAASVTVSGSFSVPGAVAGELDFFFSAPVSAPVTFTGTPTPSAPTFSGNEVIFTYAPPTATGQLTFSVTTSGVFDSGEINPNSILGTPAAVNFNFATVVPEPTSIALLGIGMSGFFAFRRLFKRTATA